MKLFEFNHIIGFETKKPPPKTRERKKDRKTDRAERVKVANRRKH